MVTSWAISLTERVDALSQPEMGEGMHLCKPGDIVYVVEDGRGGVFDAYGVYRSYSEAERNRVRVAGKSSEASLNVI